MHEHMQGCTHMVWAFGVMAVGSARLGVLVDRGSDRMSRNARIVRVFVRIRASGEGAMRKASCVSIWVVTVTEG